MKGASLETFSYIQRPNSGEMTKPMPLAAVMRPATSPCCSCVAASDAPAEKPGRREALAEAEQDLREGEQREVLRPHHEERGDMPA